MEILDKLIYESTIKIIKPISEQISNRLLIFLGLKDIIKNEIYFKDLSEGTSDTQTKDHRPKTSNLNRCDVTTTAIYDPKEVKWNSFDFNHTGAHGMAYDFLKSKFPIFVDNRNNISLYEYNTPMRLELNFNIKLANIELIDIAITGIYNKFSSSSIVKYHDIQFKYPLPDIMLFMLYKLFKLKDTSEDMTFQEYIKIGSNSQISLVMNRDNLEQKQLNILKSNVFVLGEMEYDYGVPDSEKKNKLSNRYGIKFKYTIEFSKPNMLRLFYPIVIDNKPIPKEYIISSKDRNEILHTDVNYTNPFIVLNKYHDAKNTSYKEIYEKYKLIKYPQYDKWIIPSTTNKFLKEKYIPIFSGILHVSEDNIGNYISVNIKKEILPLLSNVASTFVEEVLLYQKNDSKYDFSLLNITIFRDNFPMELDAFEIDETLNILSRENISKKYIYRIVFNLAYNWDNVNNNYIIYGLTQSNYLDFIIIRNANKLKSKGYITIHEKDSKMTSDGFVVNESDTISFKGDFNGLNGAFRVGRFIIRPLRFIK